MFGKITATASYVPEQIVTNQQLSEIMDTSDDWIFHVQESKNVELVMEKILPIYVRMLLRNFGIKGLAPDELDFILVATITPDFNTPAVACQVQGNIGAHRFCF